MARLVQIIQIPRDPRGNYKSVRNTDEKGSIGASEKTYDARASLIGAQPFPSEPGWHKTYSSPLLISFCLFVSSLPLYLLMRYGAPSDAACQKHMWAYSPMTTAMEYEWAQYDSDLLPVEYFGPPTPERQAVWRNQWDRGNIGYPYERMRDLNKTTFDHEWWRLPPPRDNQVISFPEMIHHAHCVTLLWQFAYRELWDWRTIRKTTELIFSLHTNHCFLSLKTIIECQADVTPVLFQHDSSDLGTWKTRNAPHRCRRFDVLMDWTKENAVCRSDCSLKDFE